MITEGKTVGEILRAAREDRKLTLEQVNRETKISTQTLSSLEQDEFASFESETYLKGFLRTYADFLGLEWSRLWGMMGTRSGGAGSGPGPSWEIESAVREEKILPPRLVRRLLVPVLLVAILVMAVLLVRERRRHASPLGVRVPAPAAVEAAGAAG